MPCGGGGGGFIMAGDIWVRRGGRLRGIKRSPGVCIQTKERKRGREEGRTVMGVQRGAGQEKLRGKETRKRPGKGAMLWEGK